MLGEAGDHEVADAAEAIECRRLSSSGFADADHFCEGARDQGGFGVVSQVEAI